MTRRHSFKRSDRIGELLHREIGRILRFEVGDPRLESVTVTAVRSSDDLREATVFVSVPEQDKVPALKGLEKASSFIRTAVGRRCYLKYVPQLHFRLDTSLENAARVESLLDMVRREREAREDEDNPGEKGTAGEQE